MFSRPEVVSLTTWPAGHLFGLDVRWKAASQAAEELVEVFRRREPDVALWHLWKPAIDIVLIRQIHTGRVIQVATITLALAAVLSHEMDRTSNATRCRPDVDLHQ